MAKPVTVSKAFTPHYKTKCFSAWYAAGRPVFATKIKEAIPEDEYGRKPSDQLLREWRYELHWDAQADVLDAKVDAATNDELVNQRILMLKDQAAMGRQLQIKGMEYLLENDFDTSASAVSAIFKGATLERTSRGISENLVKMHKMDNDQLIQEVQKLIDRANESGEVIDMQEVEEDAETE